MQCYYISLFGKGQAAARRPRQPHPVFEAKLKKVKPAKGETRAEVEEYFRDKYEHLKAFLRQAIDRKESVQCSL